LLVGSQAGEWLVESRPLARPDAILSLSSHEWERLPGAARLAVENPLALVLLTLPQPATKFNCHDCANRPKRLQLLGVNPARIRIIPITASGTYGEALVARDFMVKAGLRRLDVVTSPYHTRRSLTTFEAILQGTGVAVGIVPSTETSSARPDRWWQAPYDRAYVSYEWAAVAYYWLRYHIPVMPVRPDHRQTLSLRAFPCQTPV
jgi:uncharacterized SAM-binding protein YcdF (DUF218 family)